MPTTLAIGPTVITLPVDERSDLIWVDEFDFSPLAADARWSMGGKLIVDEVLRTTGRPITLQGGDSYGWVTRATVEQLEAWRALPAQQFTLTYRGTAHTVLMDHARGAVTVRPYLERISYLAGDFYIPTLRFLKV